MDQLTQNLKNGDMKIMEVPFPAMGPNDVLVRNYYSVISPGTEGKTVSDARKNYLQKAKSRKEEVKKVLDTAKTHGLMKTYSLVMNKLEAYNALGYSCAGKVIALGENVKNVRLGDFVACGGNSASHAEVISVPNNLIVKVKDEANLPSAAFTTLGAIAMQGLRQADLRLGESCVVIGLGLVGQLSMQLLKASGIQAIGIDLDQNQVDLANKLNYGEAYNRKQDDLEELIQEKTNHFGADAVIIAASTGSTDPIELAGRIARKKAKVVIVGNVPTGFSRKNYFKKELDLRMSSSYGPGRYEANYEEKAMDYPIAYVRWTENRNMQAFVDLIENKSIIPSDLISREFDFENAKEAYDLILDKDTAVAGLLLKYDIEKELKPFSTPQINTAKPAKGIGLIGAGSFAQNFLIPALKQVSEIEGLSTARPNNAKYISDKYQIPFIANSAEELINSPSIGSVIITTRHDNHGPMLIKALEAGKNVYVEKPLCLKETELNEIISLSNSADAGIMVGFNRRFSEHTTALKKHFQNNLPKSIIYRINAGKLPLDHWVHDPEVGGGRILGEACHFIDLVQFIAGSPICSVSANALGSSSESIDNVSINLEFKNGSIANIAYFSNGAKTLEKEYLEVHAEGKSAIIEDFKTLRLIKNKESKSKPKLDKGYLSEMKAFVDAVNNGTEMPIPKDELFRNTLATFKVLESIQLNGKKIILDEND